MAFVGGHNGYKCEAILQQDSGVLVLTDYVPNIQFETLVSLPATVHFGNVSHLDLTRLSCSLQEDTAITVERLYDSLNAQLSYRKHLQRQVVFGCAIIESNAHAALIV